MMETSNPIDAEEIEQEVLGLKRSSKIVNPLTSRPYTRSDGSSGKTRQDAQQQSVYMPVKSLVSVGGSLGSRGRRSRDGHEDQEQGTRSRSRSRSREVRRIPGLSTERPVEERPEVSAWSSDEESASDSSFQSTPRSQEKQSEWRESMGSFAGTAEGDEDDDVEVRAGNPTVVVTANLSPSPAPGGTRSRTRIEGQVINYSLPLRSPTVFPTSYVINTATGEKSAKKMARGAKVQALGLGITAMIPTPSSSTSGGSARPKSTTSILAASGTPLSAASFADGIKNALSSEIGSATNTPAESEDSFAAIAPSPLWTPSVNPLIRGRASGDGETAQPFWSLGSTPLVARKDMFRRTLSGLSATRWDIDNDREAPEELEDDDHVSDAGFMDDLLEDYQLAHPPTPAAALSRGNSFIGKAFGMSEKRPKMGRGQSFASDKENRAVAAAPDLANKGKQADVLHVETRQFAEMAINSAAVPMPKSKRSHSDGPSATEQPGQNQTRMFRMVRKLTFQRPHHKDGRGKGRGGDWIQDCGEAI